MDEVRGGKADAVVDGASVVAKLASVTTEGCSVACDIYNCVIEIRFTITHYPRQRVSHHSVVSAPFSGFIRHVGSHLQRKWVTHPPDSFNL